MMTKTQAALIGFAVLMVLLVPRPAFAYLDPNTTSSLFAVLAPVIALFGVFLGYLVWPFRYVLTGIFSKKKADAEPEPEPEPETQPEVE
ncbi:hypothetical protein HQ560_17755 [bacterium]|nr:hypothetical protein [bacterium]